MFDFEVRRISLCIVRKIIMDTPVEKRRDKAIELAEAAGVDKGQARDYAGVMAEGFDAQ